MFYNCTNNKEVFGKYIPYCTVLYNSLKNSHKNIRGELSKSKEETAMVQLIVGKKGKGKTKQLLDKVNGVIKTAEGNIVYLDKSTKHMYELNNKVRLIDVSAYPLNNSDEFIGFINGIISQDHDLQEMYLDSFLKIAQLEGKDMTHTLYQLEKLSEVFRVNFVLSVSMDREEIPEEFQENILIAL